MHGSLQFKIAVTVVPYKKKMNYLQQSINTGDILQVFMSLLTGIHTKKIVLACMISATNMMADRIKTFKSP